MMPQQKFQVSDVLILKKNILVPMVTKRKNCEVKNNRSIRVFWGYTNVLLSLTKIKDMLIFNDLCLIVTNVFNFKLN